MDELTKVTTVHRLAMMRINHPGLVRAEAEARLALAAAIITWDQVEVRIAGGEPIHSINEQVAVNEASLAYCNALAALVRGEDGDDAQHARRPGPKVTPVEMSLQEPDATQQTREEGR